LGVRDTLWGRIDRLRLSRTLLLSWFLASWTVLWALPILALLLAGRIAALLVARESDPVLFIASREVLSSLGTWAIAAAVITGLIFIGFAASREERRCLARLSATRALPGEGATTRSALHEMALAAGLAECPALYFIPDDVAINAIVIGKTPRHAAVAVTTGMASRTSKELQRAVFANLLSRFQHGGVSWTTLRYMLMEPIARVTGRYTLPIRPIGYAVLGIGFSAIWAAAYTLLYRSGMARAWVTPGVIGGLWLFAASVGATLAFLLMGRLLDRSFRRRYEALVLSADAEGVLLLRDPSTLLSAVMGVLDTNTWLAGVGGLSYLAFADPSQPHALYVHSGLDAKRIRQLEELAFPAPPGSIAPAVISPLRSSSDSACTPNDAV